MFVLLLVVLAVVFVGLVAYAIWYSEPSHDEVTPAVEDTETPEATK